MQFSATSLFNRCECFRVGCIACYLHKNAFYEIIKAAMLGTCHLFEAGNEVGIQAQHSCFLGDCFFHSAIIYWAYATYTIYTPYWRGRECNRLRRSGRTGGAYYAMGRGDVLVGDEGA